MTLALRGGAREGWRARRSQEAGVVGPSTAERRSPSGLRRRSAVLPRPVLRACCRRDLRRPLVFAGSALPHKFLISRVSGLWFSGRGPLRPAAVNPRLLTAALSAGLVERWTPPGAVGTAWPRREISATIFGWTPAISGGTTFFDGLRFSRASPSSHRQAVGGGPLESAGEPWNAK
jgi:hypothetical protein